jgi:hypothetical protein
MLARGQQWVKCRLAEEAAVTAGVPQRAADRCSADRRQPRANSGPPENVLLIVTGYRRGGSEGPNAR